LSIKKPGDPDLLCLRPIRFDRLLAMAPAEADRKIGGLCGPCQLAAFLMAMAVRIRLPPVWEADVEVVAHEVHHGPSELHSDLRPAAHLPMEREEDRGLVQKDFDDLHYSAPWDLERLDDRGDWQHP
jgi:hypothetical protein